MLSDNQIKVLREYAPNFAGLWDAYRRAPRGAARTFAGGNVVMRVDGLISMGRLHALEKSWPLLCEVFAIALEGLSSYAAMVPNNEWVCSACHQTIDIRGLLLPGPGRHCLACGHRQRAPEPPGLPNEAMLTLTRIKELEAEAQAAKLETAFRGE